tara:strand:- start:907 stop:1350 length:444 start_codon:yes stop_codon:yes gene_type:complete
MSYYEIKNKLNNFIAENKFKSKNSFVYSWAILLISYHHDDYDKIKQIFYYLNSLSEDKLDTLEILIKKNEIFYDKIIIDILYKIKEKECQFELMNFFIETLMMIYTSKKNLNIYFFIFYLKINTNTKKIDALKNLLEFNRIISKFIK